MNFRIEDLRLRLNEPLPGANSHQKMMKHRLAMKDIDVKKLKAKKSAVLVIIYPFDEDFNIVLTKRAEYRGVHSGQISFPGGKVEKEDRSLEETALREAEEEIGINRNHVEVVGALSELYIPPSNFIVSPFVGVMNEKPEMKAEDKEVDQIIEMPLSYLTAKDAISPARVKTDMGSLQVNAYLFNNHIVWGATSMILSEFADVLNELI